RCLLDEKESGRGQRKTGGQVRKHGLPAGRAAVGVERQVAVGVVVDDVLGSGDSCGTDVERRCGERAGGQPDEHRILQVDGVVGDVEVEHVVDVGRGIERGVEDHRVLSAAGEDVVVASTAIDGVVALTAGHQVVAVATVQIVDAEATGED